MNIKPFATSNLSFYNIEYYNFSAAELFDNINLNVLFQARWKFEKKNLAESEWQKIVSTTAVNYYFKLKSEIIDQDLLSEAKGCYAFYPASSVDNSIIIYLQDNSKVLWTFPRQISPNFLCIADFIDPSYNNFLVIWAITTGNKIENEVKMKYNLGIYKEYFLLAGLAAELAESAAQILHKIIFQKIKSFYASQRYENNPKLVRYSFGYPSCPDLSYQKSLLQLINSELIGISLTENFMMVPEYSVAGFSIYHPNATYFNV